MTTRLGASSKPFERALPLSPTLCKGADTVDTTTDLVRATHSLFTYTVLGSSTNVHGGKFRFPGIALTTPESPDDRTFSAVLLPADRPLKLLQSATLTSPCGWLAAVLSFHHWAKRVRRRICDGSCSAIFLIFPPGPTSHLISRRLPSVSRFDQG